MKKKSKIHYRFVSLLAGGTLSGNLLMKHEYSNESKYKQKEEKARGKNMKIQALFH